MVQDHWIEKNTWSTVAAIGICYSSPVFLALDKEQLVGDDDSNRWNILLLEKDIELEWRLNISNKCMY